MHWKPFGLRFLALLFLLPAFSMWAQVTHAGTEGELPLTVGSGWSNYSIDWGPGTRMDGITVWADWRFRALPSHWKGLGVSVEGQYIAWNIPEGLGQHKLESGLGGPSYQFQSWHRIRPYVKYLIGFGGMYFVTEDPFYTHDTRVIYAPGGGADVRVWNKLALRIDYEYQYWPNLFRGHTSNPNGVTVGAVWDFGIRSPAQ